MPSTASYSNGSSAGRLLSHLRSGSTTATPLGHGPYQRAKQASPTRPLSWHGCRTANGNSVNAPSTISTSWFATGPTTRRHVIAFLSWARQQRIIRNVDVPVISTKGAEASPPVHPTPGSRRSGGCCSTKTLAPRRPHRRLPCHALRPAGQQDRRTAHDRYLLRRRRHPAQARRRLARRARARCHTAAATSAQPQQHDHGSQPGLVMAVSRAARRRTSQLPPPRPCSPPTWHPRPGEPAGRVARARPRSTTSSPRRRAGRLAGHSYAPRVLRRRRLVRRPGEGRRVEAMDVRLFGQLEAADGGVALAVRGAKKRALLALLALHRGEPVSADRLIDVLWGDGLAAKPANALQALYRFRTRPAGAVSCGSVRWAGCGRIAVHVLSAAVPDHGPGLWLAGAAGPQPGVQERGDHDAPS